MVFFMYLLALLSIEEYGVSSLVGGKVSDLTRGYRLAYDSSLPSGWNEVPTCRLVDDQNLLR